MGVLLKWAAATVLGGVMGASAVGFCPSRNVDGTPTWPVELREKLRHDLGPGVRPAVWNTARNRLYWLPYREYEAAFGASYWASDCNSVGPPRQEPELALSGTRELREKHLADCARDRERAAWWERDHADQRARRLAHRDPG